MPVSKSKIWLDWKARIRNCLRVIKNRNQLAGALPLVTRICVVRFLAAIAYEADTMGFKLIVGKPRWECSSGAIAQA